MYREEIIKSGGIPIGKSFSESGKISTNSWVDLFEQEIDFARFNDINLILENLEASNIVEYQVLAYNRLVQPNVELVLTSGEVAVSTVSEILALTSTIYAKIIVQIKSKTTDQHSNMTGECYVRKL